jgi:WD40 repeat protein
MHWHAAAGLMMTGNSNEQTPGSGQAELDTTGEFFSVGTPLHAVRAGYVRRRADDVLYEALIAGKYAHVVAPCRSGKTSLIAATTARLENNGFKVAILDLEQIGMRDGGSDAGRWYYSVAYRLLRQLRVRSDLQSWWQDKSILSNRQRLVEFYSEVLLQNVQERIVVFVDGIECVEHLPFADQLLASIRAAHNARTTDPEFSRISFVLLGECDSLSLVDTPEQSPFNISQAVSLNDFTRDELDIFATELGLSSDDAKLALNRVFHWTGGQPYLTQKLARSVAREQIEEDVATSVDRIATRQLAGRAALHSEPHMSHIHRAVVSDRKRSEALLNMYGRLRKGIPVAADLGSALQRRLIALGLLVIDADGNLKVRNRLYAAVFTARWANENLPTHWRVPAIAVAILLAIVAVPFSYTQLLPRPYVSVLTSTDSDLQLADTAYTNLRSFPGHSESADNLYRSFLQSRARAAVDEAEISMIVSLAAKLPGVERFSDELLAAFWDRRAKEAMRVENRDDALLATLQSLVLSTSQRRDRAASLVADDYPLLLASLPAGERGIVTFNAGSLLLTETNGAAVSQWSFSPQGLQRRDDWTITALEVAPLVRRVIVDQVGEVRRIGLTLNISHSRLSDMRIKVIAPSGRAVEVDPGRDRAASNEDIRIPAAQLSELVGEPINGTWSISIRDEVIGVAGRLVGWNLKLNSQGLIEDFQRGLNVPEPVERETENLWFSDDGRFAVARATQSDSARIWDLAFAKPVRAIVVSENEKIIGLGAGERYLVTATQDTVNLWDTTTGKRHATLPVGAASTASELTKDGQFLFVQRRGDIETHLELWALEKAAIETELVLAGAPAFVSLDQSASRIAVADYDRAVRIWDFRSGTILAQVDLAAQPSSIRLAADGATLGAIYGEDGASLWRVDSPLQPMVEKRGYGRWQLAFASTGASALLGTPAKGFQLYDSSNGRMVGPPLGSGGDSSADNLLAYSDDAQIIITGGPNSLARFWRAPAAAIVDDLPLSDEDHLIWPQSGDAIAVVTPDASDVVIGDRSGDLHILPADSSIESVLAESDDVGFLGHNEKIELLRVSSDGVLVASVAADNSIRIWSTDDGQPQPFFANISGNKVSKIEFSPDASLLGVLNGSRAQVLDVLTGEIVARFDLGEEHRAMTFAGADRLYVGSESGALKVISHDAPGTWGLQTLWQGDSPIRWLDASPRLQYLVLVDQQNRARQFGLEEGQLAAEVLQLPDTVEEVSFSPNGSRVLFRTPRWIHRATVSTIGLSWLNAAMIPVALPSAQLVFGDAASNSASASGNRVFVATAGDSFMRLVEVRFGAGQGAGLFGNKDELLEEWQRKLPAAAIDSTN